MTYYRETQTIWPWMMVLLLGVVLITVFIPLWFGVQAGRDREAAEFVTPMIISLALMPLVLNLMCLRTDVQRDQVYVRLGFFFPMMWRRIPLDSIAEVRVVQYRPLRDVGGWGYRLGRFEGTRCWYYTMRGREGVLILTDDNRQHIIGSQDPDSLVRAIRMASEKDV